MMVVEGIACKFYKDKEGEVYISAPFGDKYGIESGNAIVLDEKYDDRHICFSYCICSMCILGRIYYDVGMERDYA